MKKGKKQRQKWWRDYRPPKCALPGEDGGVLANPEQPNQNIMTDKERDAKCYDN